ncbi:MAG TPA: GNAT family N-acetyltransferase [Actinomycetota bacterium]|nr:GNAT family N-acetyltransferase [Actinomycetota bacterium]
MIAHPLGEALRHPRLPRSQALNALYVDGDVGMDALVAALEDLYAGLPHRRAVVTRADTGERLAPRLRDRGWHAERDVHMALRRPRDRPAAAGLAREVDADTLAVADAAIARETMPGISARHLREILDARRALAASVPTARYFVGAADGVDATVATLYSDGTVAQVEDVGTLRAHRGRGLARATVSLAVDAAVAMGHDLVFLVADADDWPKGLYARLGFEPIGVTWTFLRRVRPEAP